MKYSKGIDTVRLPRPGAGLGGMQVFQKKGDKRDIERFRDEKEKSKREEKASALPNSSDVLAEQSAPSREEIERLREEKKRPDKPAPQEPSPAPEPEPQPDPEQPKE